MPDLLIRDIDETTLKRRAERNNRSREAELKMILEEAAAPTASECRAALQRFRAQLGDRKFPDSAELVREDRDR